MTGNPRICSTPTRSEKIVKQVALEKLIQTSQMELQAGMEGITTDPSGGGPYVMWKDTDYAHIMIPVDNGL